MSHAVRVSMAAAVVCAVSLLPGCAVVQPNRYETQAAFDAGWRVAEVIDVARADRITEPVAHDCRASGVSLPADTPYALLRFADGSRHHRSWATVAVPDPAFIEKGEVVYVDVSDCAAALVRRNARS